MSAQLITVLPSRIAKSTTSFTQSSAGAPALSAISLVPSRRADRQEPAALASRQQWPNFCNFTLNPQTWSYSSPEKRSHADCLVMSMADPILVQVIPRDRACRTQMLSCRSTEALAAAILGRVASRSSSETRSSQLASFGISAGSLAMISGWLAKISAHSPTHSLQMNTPGPAIIFSTSAVGFRQKVQATAAGASLDAVIGIPSSVSRLSGIS
jgi:hypothetical protein